MALKVRSATGQTFHRCGMTFGSEAVIVPLRKLSEPFGSPQPSKNRPQRIGDVLVADKGLYCDSAEDPDDDVYRDELRAAEKNAEARRAAIEAEARGLSATEETNATPASASGEPPAEPAGRRRKHD